MQDDTRQAEQEARWRAWMQAAQNGDSAAFEKLLQELLPRIRSSVFRRLGGREHAEDVVQVVLLSIHRSRHTYQPSRAFTPWLNAVTRNAVIDSMRARRNEWRSQPFEEHEHAVADDSCDKEFEPLSPELTAALDRLPDAQREALELLHIQELSLREAAERVGSTPGAFKVRAHRARARLREILEESKA